MAFQNLDFLLRKRKCASRHCAPVLRDAWTGARHQVLLGKNVAQDFEKCLERVIRKWTKFPSRLSFSYFLKPYPRLMLRTTVWIAFQSAETLPQLVLLSLLLYKKTLHNLSVPFIP